MKSDPANIYESEEGNFVQETERLSSFDLPTQLSIRAIGHLKAGNTLLDIGAGPNTDLFRYVTSQGGKYTAVDRREAFLHQQQLAGAVTVKADVRHLPIDDESFDTTHARFVISHLGKDKLDAIKEVLRVTKPHGRAILMDYDWASAHGSQAFEKVKDFMINGGFLFDADFGAELEQNIQNSGVKGQVDAVIEEPTQMLDYSQVLKLREAGSTDLKIQGKEVAVKDWNDALDELQREADSNQPPGFFFPGVVIVTFVKD